MAAAASHPGRQPRTHLTRRSVSVKVGGGVVVHVCGLSTLFKAATHNAMVKELVMMAPWSLSSRSTSSTAAVSGVIMAESAACRDTWEM
jgi:hypothetical protein